jgi:glycosyltransferase involved in cell wall biosynthesis
MFKLAYDVNWDAVDRVIVVSRAMQRQFAAQFPSHAHKTVVIPVGVSVDRFRPDGRAFDGSIGTLCYLTPRKRVYELILAFHQLRQQRRWLRLHVGGSRQPEHGDYYDAMMRLTTALDLNGSVVFDGDVSEPSRWYGKIDIFVSNSYSEGAQVALMEAMAAGRYSLSHHWEGAEELLPDDYLYLTDSEFTAKVLRYCDESEHTRRLHQERLRDIARERLDIEGVKERIREVLEEAAEIGGGRRR